MSLQVIKSYPIEGLRLHCRETSLCLEKTVKNITKNDFEIVYQSFRFGFWEFSDNGKREGAETDATGNDSAREYL